MCGNKGLSFDNIFARLAGAGYFTKFGLTQAYQQFPLDNESKQLLVVNTLKGLFQFMCLPYEVSTAPIIFQSVMGRILQGLSVTCKAKYAFREKMCIFPNTSGVFRPLYRCNLDTANREENIGC